MCGITAYFSANKDYSKQDCQNSIKKLNHRWPDKKWQYFSPDKKLFLWHSLLAINDEEATQPFFSSDWNLVVVVNGEFYEYRKIKFQLEKKGYIFNTNSDSEIVLYLYQEYGSKFIDYLRGEFAIVLYDFSQNTLIAVRDRFGIKPLSYYLDSKTDSIYIASEAKALFEYNIKPEWDMYSLYHSLNFQYTPQNRTLFKGIKQIKPWYMLIYNSKEVNFIKYWDIDYSKQIDIWQKQLENKLEQELIEAVKIRLDTKKKYCFHLSGGIDSSLIAGISSKLMKQKIDCFTVSFQDKIYDEQKLASQQAKHIWANFTNINIWVDEMIDYFQEAIYASEWLAINNHLVSKYLLNQKIKEKWYKIILTGEGADEAFLWYSHFKQDMLGNKFADQIKEENFVSSWAQLPHGDSLNLAWFYKKIWFIPTFVKAKASIGFKLRKLLSKNLKNQFATKDIYSDIADNLDFSKEFSQRNKVYISDYIWTKFTLANYILKTLWDWLEAPHSLEARLPFLDHKLFEFATSIAITYKLKWNTEKYILRKIASKYVISDIIEKWKQPFMAPPILFSPKGFEFIYSIINSSEFANMWIFDVYETKNFVETLKTIPEEEYAIYEPIMMMILSVYFIDKTFIHKN